MKLTSHILSSTWWRAVHILKRNHSFKPSWKIPQGQDTGISIYNCISGAKVPLILKDNSGTWYSCGPTVYDSAHIGHASCYVKLDIIQRILINYFNINLITSMGITDIDDKIIKKSNETKVNIKLLTQEYEAEFWKNMSDLNILPPDFVLRVTDNIPAIVSFIETIENNKLAYKTTDNSVYFDTDSYGKYGKLHNAQSGEFDDDSSEKKSPTDFVLWKSQKAGEPHWESAWGNGRPGWHIECSAMVTKLFGKNVDFHAGGIDLQFPHHENEEAQSCAYHNSDQWVNYWLHTGHLHLREDVKMSKSLKNTISIDSLLNTHSSETFRMACLMSHYRYSMEFSDEVMSNAKSNLEKIKFFLNKCKSVSNNLIKVNIEDERNLKRILSDTKEDIRNSLSDDFDTAKCITHLMKLLKETNKTMKPEMINSNSVILDPILIVSITKYIKKLMTDFGFSFDVEREGNMKTFSTIVDTTVHFRSNVRMRALQTKDTVLLKECDGLRTDLQKHKIYINDKPSAQSLWVLKE